MSVDYNKANGIELLTCDDNEAEYIHNKLIEHNIKYITNAEEFKFCLKDSSGKIIGGIIASKDNESMTIDFLWVDESLRGKGYGGKLIKNIEDIAKDTDCIVIWLNTFGFQAPEFYTKMGYQLFGVLEKCINGYDQYFFKKIIK